MSHVQMLNHSGICLSGKPWSWIAMMKWKYDCNWKMYDDHESAVG